MTNMITLGVEEVMVKTRGTT